MKLDLSFFDIDHGLIKNITYNIIKSDINVHIYKDDELLFVIKNTIEDRMNIIKIIWTNFIKLHIYELHDKVSDFIISANIFDNNNKLLFETAHLTYDECINQYEFPYTKTKQLFDIIYITCHHDIV